MTRRAGASPPSQPANVINYPSDSNFEASRSTSIHSQVGKAALLPLLQTAMEILRGTQICVLALLGLILIVSSTSVAQTSTRIKFRRGAIHADVSGTLNGLKSKRTYLIKVRAGQTLQTEQIGDSPRRITIFVKDPAGNDIGDSDASCNSRREISPTEAGDYRIEVVECLKADPWRGRFTFRVTVR